VTYGSDAPWPAAANGGGASLELIDTAQDASRVVNWAASTNGGTPGSVNGAAGTIDPVPPLSINEILSDNVSINSDPQGEFDPWIELYNAGSETLDLGGMYLTNDLGQPTMWRIPDATEICGGCWALFWADGDDVGDHANFILNPLGGTVAVSDATGRLIDFLPYGSAPADHAIGRLPDGGQEVRVLSIVTPSAANDAPVSALILNEYNAVENNKKLKNQAADTYWGRVDGNGGDWFEIVVTDDHVDARGWDLVITNATGDPLDEEMFVLTLTEDEIWADLRAGTIVTVSEMLPDDTSYDPLGGDWWINVQANDTASGAYITPQSIRVSNRNWQLLIRDAQDVAVFGPAGEGIRPISGVGNDEVFKLEQDPGPFITPLSNYEAGSSSTFGAPNRYSATRPSRIATATTGGMPAISVPTIRPTTRTWTVGARTRTTAPASRTLTRPTQTETVSATPATTARPTPTRTRRTTTSTAWAMYATRAPATCSTIWTAMGSVAASITAHWT
jgi:hypothetical protein